MNAYDFEKLFQQAVKDLIFADKRLTECLETLETVYNSGLLAAQTDQGQAMRKLVKDTILGETEEIDSTVDDQ
jgi:hypothetical protein